MAKVGQCTRAWTDPYRTNWAGTGPRPLLTEVWYPAPDTVVESDIGIGPPGQPFYTAGKAARDVALVGTPPHFPCLLLSHGTGGSALQLGWLGTALAAQGYMVASVNHHGNTSVEPYTAQGFGLWWERAQDLRVVLDHLLADARFGSRIDPMRIGAAGFSLGGYTVIAVAGGRTDLQAFAAFCSGPERDATCEDQAEFPGMRAQFAQLKRDDARVQASLQGHGASFRDPRICAVFAIAPALGGAFTPAGLAEVSIPVAIVVGQADTVAPPPTNAQRFARGIPGATLTVLPGQVGHYTFLSEGTAYGKQISPTFCLDHASIDRAAVHKQVAQMAAEFFAQHLATSQASKL
jgi:predicted dienelactone hydrolase